MSNTPDFTLPMMRLEPMSPKDGYMVSAAGLLPSLKLLALSGNEHLRANALVGGLVLECSLKAFMTQKSVPPLPQPYGHDLEMLWCDAVNAGLAIDQTPPQWCVTLNCLHFENKNDVAERKAKGDKRKDVEFRYPLRYQAVHHGLSFPVTSDMLQGIWAVFEAVEQSLKTS